MSHHENIDFIRQVFLVVNALSSLQDALDVLHSFFATSGILTLVFIQAEQVLRCHKGAIATVLFSTYLEYFM